ncbi:hypothetical protein [Pacificoceanicola onchidii]|uniref:hypothetical protein n=1 Tax=Pacificoceanicola onchidii TaxID=2562685 RepID=UPI0010A60593|nr:hypothetical protein [Pacificoceanicola onchidii]
MDIVFWLFNRKSPYIALFFLALSLWFTFDGYQTLRERSFLDREGLIATATVTNRYIKPATCPGETGLTAALCNTDLPYADFTFEVDGVTIEGSKSTRAVFNFMETDDTFDVTYAPGNPENYRVETGQPRESGWMHWPLGLAFGPILMAVFLALFWRKGGLVKLRGTA